MPGQPTTGLAVFDTISEIEQRDTIFGLIWFYKVDEAKNIEGKKHE